MAPARRAKKMEPFEEVIIDLPKELAGPIIETLGRRKGIMMQMKEEQGSIIRLVFEAPTRGILGYKNQFTIDTKGEGIMCSRFIGFRALRRRNQEKRHRFNDLHGFGQGGGFLFVQPPTKRNALY